LWVVLVFGAGLALPPPALAQFRPAPVEVAELVASCIESSAPATYLTIGSTDSTASLSFGSSTTPAYQFSRKAPDVQQRPSGRQVWLDDDPFNPPMVMEFVGEPALLLPNARAMFSNCFHTTYEPLALGTVADGWATFCGKPQGDKP
jgi:hypothetical protein